jgi:hypothetical protein
MWTYSSAEFDNLHKFHDAKAVLAEYRKDIGKIGNVIFRHGFHEFIGANLLHKHFHLRPDERLLRRYSFNSAEMRPDNLTTDIVPYLWKLKETDGAYSLVPLEFIQRGLVGDDVEAVAQILIYSREFIFDIGSTLHNLNLLDGFGLVILNSGVIRLEDGEILLERTDHQNRILTLKPCPIAVAGETTETTWSFQVQHLCDNCRRSIHSISERKREKIERWKGLRMARIPALPPEPEEFLTHPCPEVMCSLANHCDNHCICCEAHCGEECE